MKKSVYILCLWIVETITYIFLFNLLGLRHDLLLSFYVFYFGMLLMFHHFSIRNNLIWSEMRDLITAHFYYFVFSSFSIVVFDVNRIRLFLLNLAITLIMFVLTLIYIRTSHILFRKQLAGNTLIIGVNENAQKIGYISHSNRFALMNVIGFVDYFSVYKKDKFLEKPVFSSDEMEGIITQHRVDQVIIVLPQASSKQLNEIVDRLSNLVDRIKFVPSTYDLMDYESEIQDFDGILLVSTVKSKIKPFSKFVKRLVDIVAGIVGCIILIPVTIGLKIIFLKNGDKAPLIFTQIRIGKNGKPIKIYKYRSMVPDAEKVLEELMEKNESIKQEYLKNKKLQDDPRITPIGEKLRKTSLDELPQLINVLKGEMSLVGPRPYLFREIDDMIYYDDIIKCKPGLTGMWQVSGRSDIGFKERCHLDEYYYRNWAFWLDFTILVKTIKIVLYGNGAM
ncbi:hypothetical protein B5F14_09815 [Faecalitalea cylindroides]|uniref:Bacterial sugar transferase domain-containing protein n=1 Tax=Faecalitalea cylindroides TaxID=39483 RepID=A0A1Y4LKB6_9FIRM|nr:exopolysaccharide biosynthesis polyprenyl glycosylphosphotransferase [Faecalitalea cylindroides]OUP56320.1 hypothetical protein B5F14_09815 [Faecalitalea cylindroides]